jgi:hypothetical protein
MRIATAALAVICLLVSLQLVRLTYLFASDTANPHHSDYAIGWFWISVYAGLPLLVLVGLGAMHWRTSSNWLRALVIAPPLLAIASAAVMFGPLA